jgi:hypothetical protein
LVRSQVHFRSDKNKRDVLIRRDPNLASPVISDGVEALAIRNVIEEQDSMSTSQISARDCAKSLWAYRFPLN